MRLSSDQKTRLVIAAALILGWIVAIFFRSGTAWG